MSPFPAPSASLKLRSVLLATNAENATQRRRDAEEPHLRDLASLKTRPTHGGTNDDDIRSSSVSPRLCVKTQSRSPRILRDLRVSAVNELSQISAPSDSLKARPTHVTTDDRDTRPKSSSVSPRLCVKPQSRSPRILRDLRVSAVNGLLNNRRRPAPRLAATLLLTLSLSAAVIDRIAVVVGNTVITETEVLQEARLEAFLNQAPLDLSAQQRRTAAERLVDQQLVRNEMRIGSYPDPSPAEVDSMLQNFRKEHFNSAPAYQAALVKYGVTEEQLRRHLSWQLSAIRFTDIRFGVPDSAQQSADRVRPGGAMPKPDVDQQMDAWLKETRSTLKVQFKPGAFQ